MPVNLPPSTTPFKTDLLNRHLIYDYSVQNPQDPTSEIQKWRYELWFYNEDRVVYEIHGGPMAGRRNYQEATYQCIRPGELWQVNWLEETGTIVSLVFDISNKKVTTLIAFSRGHWERPEEARGDKWVQEDLERFRGLSKVGSQVDRVMLRRIYEGGGVGGDLDGMAYITP
ncbi:phenol acid carboxylase [Aspergillus stella-maris]|uniref:phenol acid carboxylase n=1 Tax=Aspergillus stella-maris TaxID=1810926 RepID=UPI003CCD1087